MGGTYDFDKTILSAYNQGRNRGVDMVNRAEKKRQWDALYDLKQKQFDMQDKLFKSGLAAQEQFAEDFNAIEASKKRQREYNKAVDKNASRVDNLNPFQEGFWSGETARYQLGWFPPTKEELYKSAMERAGTPELGVKPETYQTQVTPEMAGHLQLLQLLLRNQSSQIGDSSIQELLYQVYGGE